LGGSLLSFASQFSFVMLKGDAYPQAAIVLVGTRKSPKGFPII
jgi:hypothetical protein